jgi:probable F420-dependent oxidoreductase
MKFGIATFVTDEGIRPGPLGRAIEERGFDSLFIAEHSHIPASRETPYPGGGELPRIYYRTLDPFVTLSAIAPVTERLLLGTGVALVIQRDPIHTAKEVASLDLVSGGRAVLGIGAGWNREEMRDHGTDPRTRGRRLDEQMRAIRELWTKEEAEFHGEFVDFDAAYCWPKPVQQPHPPIYVGGGEAAFARIAEYGDAWLAGAHAPEKMAGMIEKLNKTAGREVPVTVFGVQNDRARIDAYAELGVERALLFLPTEPEDESLRTLDAFAETAASFG